MTKTIGNWGCLMVAYNMQARHWGLTTEMPDRFMVRLKNVGAMSGPYVLPAALATAYPDKVAYNGYLGRSSSDMIPKIKQWLDNGRPVPARVDFRPPTSEFDQHWVLLVGYTASGDFWMADPWFGDISLVSGRYGIAGTDILEAIFYTLRSSSPTPLPVPPQYSGPAVVYTPMIHGPGSDWMWAQGGLRSMFSSLGLPVKFLSNGVSKDYFNSFRGQGFNLTRIMWKSSIPKSPLQAWQDIGGDVIAMYSAGARDFEALNEPNLIEEGMSISWASGDAFGAWLREFITIMKGRLPDARIWYPGLSPGVPWTNQFGFTSKAWPHVRNLCYGLCLHAYSGNIVDSTIAAKEIVDQVTGFQEYMSMDKPIVVSEVSVNRGLNSPTSAALETLYKHKAETYRKVDALLRARPGIQAAVYFISLWQPPESQATHYENWYGTSVPTHYKGT